jgi:zinc protease
MKAKMNALPASSLPGPENITETSLSNGIKVMVRENFNSPSVVLGGHLPCGALFDPREKLGLADFTALGLMRGTARRSFQEIYEALESNAASLGFGGGMHTTGFNGRALAEDLPLLLDLLKESLLEPIFPVEEIERLRAQLMTGLALRAQDTGEMAALTFDQLLFREHPYAQPEDGWLETVAAITRDDLLNFHREHFGPGGMVLALVGAVEAEKAIALVEKALGGWSNPQRPALPKLPAFQPLPKSSRRKVIIPGKAQSDIAMGSNGPTRKSPDFLPASLGNSALGQFGLGGRIGDAVREKSGLAYYAHSMLNAGIGPGTWVVSAGVNPGNVEKTIDLVTKELRHFVDKGIRPEELADSQSNFIGRLPLALESNAGMANALLNIERYDLGLDYYQRYPDLVGAVTRAAVVETARRYLDPDKLAIAVAGV